MTRHEALQTLGVEADADQDAIRHSYRRLCLKLHPDRFRDPAKKSAAAGAFLKVRDA